MNKHEQEQEHSAGGLFKGLIWGVALGALLWTALIVSVLGWLDLIHRFI